MATTCNPRCAQCGEVAACLLMSGICLVCHLGNQPTCLGCGGPVDYDLEGDICDTCWEWGVPA